MGKKITPFIGYFFIAILLATGCASQGDEQRLVIVSPGSAVVPLGDTLQLSSFPADTAVTWSLDPVAGKDVGAIDAVGLYTAPSDPAVSAERVVIRATDASGNDGAAIVILTTFEANKKLSIHYAQGSARADTLSAGQRSVAVFKDAFNNVNIYTVWADNSQGCEGFTCIWFSNSVGGTLFSAPQRVDDVAATQVSPTIAADENGNAYVAWEDTRFGDRDIFVKKIAGEGAFDPLFGLARRVNVNSFGTADSDHSPSIAIVSGRIFVTWEHQNVNDLFPDVLFSTNTDAGVLSNEAFSTPSLITSIGRRPSIAVNPSGVAYIAFEDLTGFPIFEPTNVIVRRVDVDFFGNVEAGVLRQVDDPAALGPNFNARFPSIAVGPTGNVHVVWQRALTANPGTDAEVITSYDIDYATLDADLNPVNSILSLPDNNNVGLFGGFTTPTITADASNVYIAWDDWRNGIDSRDIYFTKSTDGLNFSTNRIVNDFPGSIHGKKPNIATIDGKAYLIWSDFRNANINPILTPNDVFFAREQ